MHVQPVLNSLQATLAGHAALASGDPAVEAATAHLVEALAPALRVAALDLAQQAAAELAAQLPDHSVDVLLVEGDPTLRVGEATPTGERPTSEDFDARITLRLPPSLKELIEDAAGNHGESVNGWVVDVLSNRAARSKSRPGAKHTQSFDL